MRYSIWPVYQKDVIVCSIADLYGGQYDSVVCWVVIKQSNPQGEDITYFVLTDYHKGLMLPLVILSSDIQEIKTVVR